MECSVVFSPKGFGGTDFRPVFEYVNDLIMKREIKSLKGLIYFYGRLRHLSEEKAFMEKCICIFFI